MARGHWSAIVLSLTILLIAGCGESGGPGRAAAPEGRVRAVVATAELETREAVLRLPGTVASRAPVTVAARTMGAVTALAAQEGDAVSAGQELAVLDQRQARAGLDRARAERARAEAGAQSAAAALAAARAEAELAVATHTRYLRMQAEDTVSPQEFDEVAARRLRAEAQRTAAEARAAEAVRLVEAARAAVAAAEAAFGDTRILAPCDGGVRERRVEVGDLVRPGDPLFLLETPRDLEVEAAVPEGRMGAVRPGLALEVAVPALGGRVFTAAVATVVPAADPASRSFRIKIPLPDDPLLRPGLAAWVGLPLEPRPVMWVPRGAVVHDGQLTGLFQLDGEGRARFRLIRLGVEREDRVEVLTGLAPGTRYVARPAPDLRDGVRVEAVP